MLCVTRLQGTWLNSPRNPIQWFVDGRTEFVVTVLALARKEKCTADQIAPYYNWPNSAPCKLKELSGYIGHQGDLFVVDLSQRLDKATSKQLEINGKYVVKDQDGCMWLALSAISLPSGGGRRSRAAPVTSTWDCYDCNRHDTYGYMENFHSA